MPRLYFAGSASHGRDHKRAAGGFIHGFRYTAWSLYHSLEEKYEGQPWPQQTFGVAPESVEQDLLVSAQPLCAPENVPPAQSHWAWSGADSVRAPAAPDQHGRRSVPYDGRDWRRHPAAVRGGRGLGTRLSLQCPHRRLPRQVRAHAAACILLRVRRRPAAQAGGISQGRHPL